MQNSMVVFTFAVLDQKYPFWKKLIQKVKIPSLNWSLVLRLIWICRIQWCFSIFLVSATNILLDKFGLENWNSQFKLEIRYLDLFEYAEFNGNVHLFCLEQNFFIFLYYLSNISVVYSQRFKANDFRCFYCNWKSLSIFQFFLLNR